MSTIPASKPVLPLSPKGLSTPRTVRFGSGETPDVPAQGAAEQADQAEVKAPPLTKEQKDELVKSLDALEKRTPGFMARLGQRVQQFFKGIWNSIKQLFLNKTDFAFEKALDNWKENTRKLFKSDTFRKSPKINVGVTEYKNKLKSAIEDPATESSIKERAKKALTEIEDREKTNQISAYMATELIEVSEKSLEEQIQAIFKS